MGKLAQEIKGSFKEEIKGVGAGAKRKFKPVSPRKAANVVATPTRAAIRFAQRTPKKRVKIKGQWTF